MKNSFRSDCPISCTLDLIGDKWTLLIIRDMMLSDKKTFKDFANSDEKIATNTLASRLALLEEKGIITKNKLPNNKKFNIYRLTERGIDLVPIIIELSQWSNKHRIGLKIPLKPEIVAMATQIDERKATIIENIQSQLREKVKAEIV
jgi:DNA-binding HxlR family transcriptional regulator